MTAIECTFISTLSPTMTEPTSLQDTNNNRIKHHLHHESKNTIDHDRKLDLDTQVETIIQELNIQNITLFPFIIEKYGSTTPLSTS